jgi:hypothetical protein
VTDPDAEPGLPDVLRLRSVEGVRYGTTFNRETGAYRMMFKGAHFSVENLVDRQTVNLHVANVLGDNLLKADLPLVDLVLNTIADTDPPCLGR